MTILFFQRQHYFVNRYFCFPHEVCNMLPMFSQKHTKEDMLAFFLLEKNEIMLLTYERKGRTMINIIFCFIQEANFHINTQLHVPAGSY